MILEQKHDNRIFRIESARFVEQGNQNPIICFYLYIYNGDRCEYDYLQNTIDACKQVAFDDFGVPTNSWYKPRA